MSPFALIPDAKRFTVDTRVRSETQNRPRKSGERMPGSQELIQRIGQNLVVSRMEDYGRWRLGLTSNPDRRQSELDFPGFFRFWEADTAGDARRVKEHFVAAGMQADTDSGSDPLFVYIY